MAMLTLNGTVMNVFDTPEKTNKDGEVIPASTRVQLHAENMLENGQKRMELVTLKVAKGDRFRALVGKPVSVPVGAFVTGGAIQFYALKHETV